MFKFTNVTFGTEIDKTQFINYRCEGEKGSFLNIDFFNFDKKSETYIPNGTIPCRLFILCTNCTFFFFYKSKAIVVKVLKYGDRILFTWTENGTESCALTEEQFSQTFKAITHSIVQKSIRTLYEAHVDVTSRAAPSFDHFVRYSRHIRPTEEESMEIMTRPEHFRPLIADTMYKNRLYFARLAGEPAEVLEALKQQQETIVKTKRKKRVEYSLDEITSIMNQADEVLERHQTEVKPTEVLEQQQTEVKRNKPIDVEYSLDEITSIMNQTDQVLKQRQTEVKPNKQVEPIHAESTPQEIPPMDIGTPKPATECDSFIRDSYILYITLPAPSDLMNDCYDFEKLLN